jgi:hypothetical protein
MRKMLIALVMLAVGTQAQAKVNSLTFNPGILIQLINNPNSFNPGTAVGILTASYTNTTNQTVTNPQFSITVNEVNNPADTCAPVASVTNLTAKRTIAPGQTIVLLASDFNNSINGSPAGYVCPSFQSQLQSQFQNVNPSTVGNQVQALLNRHFVVCLAETSGGTQACTELNIFNPPAATVSTSSGLILPLDQSTVPSQPTFVWTPAMYKGSNMGIDYELVISQTSAGDDWADIKTIPTGQTFYQWTGTPVLAPGTTYYWHIVSTLHSNGTPVGGQTGNGWSAQRRFTVSSVGASGPCSYTLAELDAFVKAHNDGAGDALAGFTLQATIPSSLSDPDLCAMLASPQGRFVGITITKR